MLPATSPSGPPDSFTVHVSACGSIPIERSASARKTATPSEVTPNSLWLIPARGFDEMKQQAIDAGIDWRQMSLPGPGLWQLFLIDPNGVIIELNFPIADEPEGSIGPGTDKLYPPLEEQSKEAQERTKKQTSQAAE